MQAANFPDGLLMPFFALTMEYVVKGNCSKLILDRLTNAVLTYTHTGGFFFFAFLSIRSKREPSVPYGDICRQT